MKKIEHLGEIVAIEGNVIEVKMVVSSTCVSCQAKVACGVSESVEKRVEVFEEKPQLFSVGDSVMVEISQEMGIKALWYAYIMPFVLLLSTLLVTLGINLPETVAGVSSLGVVGLYYGVLYMLRNKLEREIVFNLRKV